MKISNKIALEEHIATPATVGDSQRYFTPEVWPKFEKYLLDIHGQLLHDMDETGVELSILSMNSPSIQAIPNRKQAFEVARAANDYMAEQVAKNPKRFQAFACLPLQDPEVANRELVRCVKELGMKGTLVNGFSQVDTENNVVYYDAPQYLDFWGTLESLDVPFYMHPRDPLPSRIPHLDGHPWLTGSIWAFGMETATHALRLICSGLFDRYPKLTVILGHLGETLPNNMWRIDHRIAITPMGVPIKRKISEYLRENFYFTTSGNYCTGTLVNDVLEVGADRLMFSCDYPFETFKEACGWFDGVDAISMTDKMKIARSNAIKLFKLDKPKCCVAKA
ncbi:MAG: amidohydrolase family protein [Candidatus Korobacteraceae bacterium]|jgi:2,3-dihydroxybenzoate decarboxylase